MAPPTQRQQTGGARSTWDVVKLKGGEQIALGQALDMLATVNDAKSRKKLLAKVKAGWRKLPIEWQGGLLTRVFALQKSTDRRVRSWARKAAGGMLGKRGSTDRLQEFSRLWSGLQHAAQDGAVDELSAPLRAACAKDAPGWLTLRALRSVHELLAFEHLAPLLSLPAHRDLEVRERAVEVLTSLGPPEAPSLQRGKLTGKAGSAIREAWTAWLSQAETLDPGTLLQRDLALFLSGRDGVLPRLARRRRGATALATALRLAPALEREPRLARLLQALAK